MTTSWTVKEQGSANEFYILDDAGRWVIGFLMNGELTVERQREYAHLIAAAPAMRDALKLMLDANAYADGEGMVYFAESDTEDGQAAVKAARAAIAKAEAKP